MKPRRSWSRCKLSSRFLMSSSPTLTVTPGEEAELVVTLSHRRPFEGKAELELVRLPPGVTASPVEVEAGSKSARLSTKSCRGRAHWPTPGRWLSNSIEGRRRADTLQPRIRRAARRPEARVENCWPVKNRPEAKHHETVASKFIWCYRWPPCCLLCRKRPPR